MDNKYLEIAKGIKEQAKSFKLYLKDFVLDGYSWNIIEEVAATTKVYIFSGVIRNFFLGYWQNRDLDIVVENINNIKLSKNILRNTIIRKNKFGGFKIELDKLVVDVWDIKKTWGLVQEKKNPIPEELIKTVFFNFSAIVYDFNDTKFIFDNVFCDFLHTNMLKVIYPLNLDIALCIVNTMYYCQKYGFTISTQLCEWIINNAPLVNECDYILTQKRHFGKIKFSIDEISYFLAWCRSFCEAKCIYIDYFEFR